MPTAREVCDPKTDMGCHAAGRGWEAERWQVHFARSCQPCLSEDCALSLHHRGTLRGEGWAINRWCCEGTSDLCHGPMQPLSVLYCLYSNNLQYSLAWNVLEILISPHSF